MTPEVPSETTPPPAPTEIPDTVAPPEPPHADPVEAAHGEMPPADFEAPEAPETPESLGTPAAPLEPPAPPAAPAPAPVVPEPPLRYTALPGVEFVDLVDERGNPVDPNEMFTEVGPHATYVLTALRISRRHQQPGATRTSDQLLYPAGRRIDKGEAARLRGELEALRAAQAAR